MGGRAWSRWSRENFLPNSAATPAENATAGALSQTIAPATAPWASSSRGGRKMAALGENRSPEATDPPALDRIRPPAGLDLGAITPEEIAMSILAEITIERRRGQRG